MKFSLPVFIFFLFAIVLIFSTQEAFACSCAVSPTVDIAFKETPNVVIVRIDELQAKKNGFSGEENYYLSKMTVEKVFKGNLKPGQQLNFSVSGTSCDYTFSKNLIGSDWLFYLNDNKTDDWYYPACTRSGMVKNSVADIKFIETIAENNGKTRLSGTVSQVIESAIESSEIGYKQLANRNIRVTGNGKNLQLRTDENGVYEIYDLPLGKYKVSVEPITGYKTALFDYPNIESVEIEISKTNRHFEQNFNYYIDNSISGKFFDSSQNPLKDVCLDLYPVDGVKTRYFHNFDCTNEKGEFKFNQIPVGNYIIVINNKNEISARQPFGTFYYPDKIKKEEATIISINAGEHLKDFVITAPNTAEVITISGVLLFENGKPVVDESVEFYSEETIIKQKDKDYKTEDSRASTDKNGRFTIRILKGKKGKLLGSMITYEGEYENCPKLDKLIRAKGNSLGDVETPSIEVDAISDLTGVVLKFPFPACKKAKI